jgi:hypothetical protein
MKVTTNSEPYVPKFKPITLTLVLESPEDAQILRRIAGRCGPVANVLIEGSIDDYAICAIPRDRVVDTLRSAFQQIEQELMAQNVPL